MRLAVDGNLQAETDRLSINQVKPDGTEMHGPSRVHAAPFAEVGTPV